MDCLGLGVGGPSCEFYSGNAHCTPLFFVFFSFPYFLPSLIRFEFEVFTLYILTTFK